MTNEPTGGIWPPPPPSSESGHGRVGANRDPALVLLLGIITCGIYYFYFIYVASKEAIDYLQQPDTDPALEVLLSLITCGFYTIYWDYKIGRKVGQMMQLAGIPPVDNSILYLVLNLLGVGIVPMMIVQGHLNEIWRKR